jgi:hypothetical protein
MLIERVLFNVVHYKALILKGTFAGSVSDVLAYDAVSVPKRRRYYHCDLPILRKDFVLLINHPGRPYYYIVEETEDGISSLRTVYF